MDGEHETESETLLTTREVADLARVNPATVQRWAKSGALVAVRIGPRLLRFRRDDVETLLGTTGAAS